jgi:hypothetical protein
MPLFHLIAGGKTMIAIDFLILLLKLQFTLLKVK